MEKIKVVFIQDKLVCGGAEQALYDLVRLMDKEKFEVTVFVQKPGGAWDQKFRDAGISVIYDYSCRRATLNPVTKLQNIIKKLKTQAAYKKDGQGLLDVCYPEGADIIVAYSMWDYPLSAFGKKARSVKFIHGNMATDEQFRGVIMHDEAILDRFERVVCVSQVAKEAYEAFTGITRGVEVHFNPIDSENINSMSREPIELPDDKPIICAVGRLAPEKGFERLIVIHKRLLEEGIDHRLVIVGDGPDRDYIRRTVAAMDAQDSVILAGYQANPYPYIRRSKFLVCPSYTEGLSMTALEALCMGIPVVAAVPSVGELLEGETCGLITENDNTSLRIGIKKMLTDEEFYNQRKAGAEKKSAFFSGRRMAGEIENMFLQMMQEE